MALFIPSDIDQDLLVDLAVDYQDQYQSAEDKILALETAPNNVDILNDLFRTVHTVKGNAGFLGLYPIAHFLQDLESVLALVRSGDMPFQELIGDLTLLMLDKCHDFIQQLRQSRKAEFDDVAFEQVQQLIKDSLNLPAHRRMDGLAKAVAVLDPTTVEDEKPSLAEILLLQCGVKPTDDLLFIVQLAEQTQSRAAFWEGRLERILNWIINLNQQIEAPIDAEQLVVAVCLHDVAMAMLPSRVINKEASLTLDEVQCIKEHVWVASRMASSFPMWRVAKDILEQHQEHFDGSGYPKGLRDNSISQGAQMLAIVHSFEAITHGYSKKFSQKRPFMRAIMELNRFSGTQFNPQLVSQFMAVAREEGV